MAQKQNLTIPVPKDTYNRFEEYRGEDLSKSDAGRRLLVEGLDAAQGEPDQDVEVGFGITPTQLFLVAIGGLLVAFLFVAWAALATGLLPGDTFAVLAALTVVYNALLYIAQRRGVIGQ